MPKLLVTEKWAFKFERETLKLNNNVFFCQGIELDRDLSDPSCLIYFKPKKTGVWLLLWGWGGPPPPKKKTLRVVE